jgi:hypothetical protein
MSTRSDGMPWCVASSLNEQSLTVADHGRLGRAAVRQIAGNMKGYESDFRRSRILYPSSGR